MCIELHLLCIRIDEYGLGYIWICFLIIFSLYVGGDFPVHICKYMFNRFCPIPLPSSPTATLLLITIVTTFLVYTSTQTLQILLSPAHSQFLLTNTAPIWPKYIWGSLAIRYTYWRVSICGHQLGTLLCIHGACPWLHIDHPPSTAQSDSPVCIGRNLFLANSSTSLPEYCNNSLISYWLNLDAGHHDTQQI